MKVKIYLGDKIKLANSIFDPISDPDSSPSTGSTGTTLYETFNLLDLYDDENIELTSKLSDIEKLSNVFADLTNSFTVPATAHNNKLFKHYYDVDIDNTFNANIRVNGYIEIDTFPLRFGKIQLEGIKLKNQMPDSYKITFYGGTIQLTDLFGDDTINLLDYKKTPTGTLVKTWNSLSQFEFQYNSTNFINSINLPIFKDGHIITPLIAYADRDWNYSDGSGSVIQDTIDISTDEGAILDTELKPAIRISKILEAIETKYDISFSRHFFGSATFNNLFMWMNGKDILTNEVIDVLMDSFEENDPSLYYSGVSITGNVLTVTDTAYNYDPSDIWSLTPYIYNVTKKNGDSAVGTDIRCEILDGNGNIIFSQTKTYNEGNSYLSFPYIFPRSVTPNLKSYEFKVRFICTEDIKYTGTRVFLTNNFGSGPYDNIIVLGGQNLLVRPQDLLPNMKVIEFLQGIMKMFKLIVRPLSGNIFYVNTLNGYYGDGNVLDITEYIDMKEVNIERPLIYKNIMFKYQKTNNVLGKKFRETYDPFSDEIGYGDLKAEYQLIENKEDLKVELPFENMLFERMTNLATGDALNITIGQSISTSDYKTFNKNKSKPILFFNNGINSHPDDLIKMKFSTNSPIPVAYTYNIGNTNDEILDQVTDTINFNAEVDPWHNQVVANSLYLNYWENWVNTIYDIKQRKFNFKGNLPPRYVEEISLNDRIIINNNRYKINDYKLNLVTGDVELNLFNDIFEWSPYSVGDDSSVLTISTTGITANAGCKYYGINILKNKSWSISKVDTGDGVDWVTITTETSGFGPTEIVILIEEKASQTPPAVYLSRTMDLVINVGGVDYTVVITQNGLVE